MYIILHHKSKYYRLCSKNKPYYEKIDINLAYKMKKVLIKDIEFYDAQRIKKIRLIKA